LEPYFLFAESNKRMLNGHKYKVTFEVQHNDTNTKRQWLKSETQFMAIVGNPNVIAESLLTKKFKPTQYKLKILNVKQIK
jgi:hypothetical protein